MILEFPVNDGKNTCGIDIYSIYAVLPNYSDNNCCTIITSYGSELGRVQISLSVKDAISIINDANHA